MKRFALFLLSLIFSLPLHFTSFAGELLSGAGWHLSAPGSTEDLDGFLSNHPQINSIWGWDGTQWVVKFQAPPAPNSFNSLTALSANQGYWFFTTSTVELTGLDVSINSPLDFSNLPDGWHLLGHDSDIDVITDFQESFKQLMLWAWSDGQWHVYTLGDTDEQNQFNETYDTAYGNLRSIPAYQGFWAYLEVAPSDTSGDLVEADLVEAESNYQTMCAGCHGSQGEGASAPSLQACTTCSSLETLTQKIEDSMPLGASANCTGDCAEGLATYILEGLNETYPTAHDALREFPTHEEQLQQVCLRMENQNIQNTIRDAFCGNTPPSITSLQELQALVDLDFNGPQGDVALLEGFNRRNLRDLVRLNGRGGNPSWAIVGNSSSLVRQQSNHLNPRAIIFDKPRNRGLMAMGFVRGEQFVEMISQDPNTNELHFFLLQYEQACNADDSCNNRDLYSEETESGWTGYTLYSDEELKNTILDCLQCHQSGTAETPGSKRSLLMQENVDPWPHWFTHRTQRRSKRDMLVDYFAAHGTEERYAGIPAPLIAGSDPDDLQDFMIDNGFGDGFDTEKTRREALNSGRFEEGNLRNLNEAGLIIQPPTQDRGRNAMDNAKRLALISGYQAFREGTASEPPNMSDSFPDSAAGLAEHYLRVTPGASGEAIITQACTQCHNDHLDQSISRARFNAKHLDTMSDEELRIAQTRISLPEDHLNVMPPSRFRTLSEAERTRAIAYLQTLIDQN